jgi:5-methylcytosine-specific restriction endonuclease McrA
MKRSDESPELDFVVRATIQEKLNRGEDIICSICGKKIDTIGCMVITLKTDPENENLATGFFTDHEECDKKESAKLN